MFWQGAGLLGALCLFACAGTNRRPLSPAGEPAPNREQQAERASSRPEFEHGREHNTTPNSGGVARGSHESPAVGDAVELTDFCSEHGIEAQLNVERCVATPLGGRPNDQLWCSRREELDDNRVAYYVALYRVQGKRLAKVIELAYAAGPRPLEERENEVTYYVKLTPDVAPDAKTFDVREEENLACDEGLKRVRDELSVNPDVEEGVEQLIRKVCSWRGQYSSSGFVSPTFRLARLS